MLVKEPREKKKEKRRKERKNAFLPSGLNINITEKK
jgi:hypothetical protein